MMINSKQEKEGLVGHKERFEQEKSTMKGSSGENILDSFVKTTKEFKKYDDVNDAQEIPKTKKNVFEEWSKMVFIRGSEEKIVGN